MRSSRRLIAETVVRQAVERKTLAEKRLTTMLTRLDESIVSYDMLLRESLAYEEAVITEAVGNMDINEMHETFLGMHFTNRVFLDAIGASKAVEAVNTIAEIGNESYEFVNAGVYEEGYTKTFVKTLRDMSLVTRGLSVLTDALSSHGELGGAIGGVGELGDLMTSIMSDKAAGKETMAQVMQAFDEVARDEKKKGFLKRLGIGGRGANMPMRFRTAVHSILKAKSPGFDKVINPDTLVDAMFGVTPARLVKFCENYGQLITDYVSDQFLLKLTQTPESIMSKLYGATRKFMDKRLSKLEDKPEQPEYSVKKFSQKAVPQEEPVKALKKFSRKLVQ